jgi:hypothetical protein
MIFKHLQFSELLAFRNVVFFRISNDGQSPKTREFRVLDPIVATLQNQLIILTYFIVMTGEGGTP